MKEFWIYTAMRVGLFIGAFGILWGVSYVLFEDPMHPFWVALVAFIVSGVASYFLLEGQRDAFAARVEARAKKASDKLEEHRSKEDDDVPADEPKED